MVEFLTNHPFILAVFVIVVLLIAANEIRLALQRAEDRRTIRMQPPTPYPEDPTHID